MNIDFGLYYVLIIGLAGIRTFTLSVDSSRGVRLVMEGEVKDSISLANPSDPQTSTLLAYRPQYSDLHDSDLGALFVKIQDVFPCTRNITNYEPVCSTFSREEDGFRKGKAFVQAGDIGNNIPVFGGSVYALAVQDCPELNTSCLPNYLQVEIVCMLPRCECP